MTFEKDFLKGKTAFITGKNNINYIYTKIKLQYFYI